MHIPVDFVLWLQKEPPFARKSNDTIMSTCIVNSTWNSYTIFHKHYLRSIFFYCVAIQKPFQRQLGRLMPEKQKWLKLKQVSPFLKTNSHGKQDLSVPWCCLRGCIQRSHWRSSDALSATAQPWPAPGRDLGKGSLHCKPGTWHAQKHGHLLKAPPGLKCRPKSC